MENYKRNIGKFLNAHTESAEYACSGLIVGVVQGHGCGKFYRVLWGTGMIEHWYIPVIKRWATISRLPLYYR